MQKRWRIGRMCSLGIGVIVLLLPVFVTYAKCKTCTKAPERLQTYQEVVENILDLVDVTEDMSAEEKQRDGDKVVRTGEQQKRDMLMTSIMLTQIIIPHMTGDPYAPNRFVYQEAAIQRDAFTLSRLNNMIAARTNLLIKAGRHDDPVPKAVLTQIDKELKKLGFMELKMENDTYVWDNRKKEYWMLVHFLWKLNQLMQEVHAQNWFHDDLHSIGQGYYKTNDDDPEEAKKKVDSEQLEVYASKVKAMIEDTLSWPNEERKSDSQQKVDYLDLYIEADPEKYREFFWNVQDDYSCAVDVATNECHTARQQAREDMAYLFKQRAVHDVQNSLHVFLDSWRRLKGMLGAGTDEDNAAAKQRQESLLHSYWGGSVANSRKWRDIVNIESEVESPPVMVSATWIWIKRAFKKDADKMARVPANSREIKKVADYSDDPIETVTIDEKRAASPQLKFGFIREFGIKKKLEDREPKTDYLGNYQKDLIIKEKVKRLQYSFDNILAMQSELQVNSVFTDVNRATRGFPALSFSVHEGMHIIGDKDTENKLYYNMGQVCSKQCSNLVGKRCWGKEE